MPDQNTHETRRRFLMRSAFAASLIAGGTQPAMSTDFVPRGDDITQFYPWRIEVGGLAQGSLYLIGERPLERLLFEDLTRVVLLMSKRRAFEEENDPDRGALQSASGHAVGAIRQALNRSHGRLHNGPSDGPRTYYDYAATDLGDWDPQVKEALEELDQYVRVPLLTADRAAVRLLDQAAMKQYGATRTLKDLFTLKHDDIPATELALWRAARKSGLLWCYSQPGIDSMHAGPETGNGRICDPVTHKCKPSSNNNDYCQEVEGVCNAMGG